MVFHLNWLVILHYFRSFCFADKTKVKNILGSMPKDLWGAREQLYYFQGFGEDEQNNFKDQRKNILGSWGDLGIIVREQGSTDPLWGLMIVKRNIYVKQLWFHKRHRKGSKQSTEHNICFYTSRYSFESVVFKSSVCHLCKPCITPVFKMAPKTAANDRNDPRNSTACLILILCLMFSFKHTDYCQNDNRI